jgi:DNA-binding transcriptional ArsR family regulator
MEAKQAVEALGALAHDHRLAIYRMLVERGPEGLSAGAIAGSLGVPPSSLTFHVQHLQRAGLIGQRRVGRQLIYAADYDCMNGLMGFLTENCCGREPSGCLPSGVIPTRIKKDSSAGEKSHESMAIEKPGRLGFKRAGISHSG